MKNTINVICLLFVLFAVSCEEPNEVKLDVSSDEYLVSNNMMVFQSTEDFKNALLRIKDLSYEEKSEWASNQKFRSLFQIYLEGLAAENSIMEQFSELITGMNNLQDDDQKEEFQRKYESELNAFRAKINQLEDDYSQYLDFEYGHIVGINTYDPLTAPLLNSEGMVQVAGTILQYSKTSMRIFNGHDTELGIEQLRNNEESAFINNIDLSGTVVKENIAASEEYETYHESCSGWLGNDYETTGNTKVINTVVPIYETYWVPETCETLCNGGTGLKDCITRCIGGYYGRRLIGMDYINTYLEAIIRNYKITFGFRGGSLKNFVYLKI